MHSLRVRLKMSCAKFGVDWSRNVGGVGKKQFCGFRDLAKNIPRRPKDAADSSASVCKFLDSGRFGVGAIAPNVFLLGIAPPSGRHVWIWLSE